MTRFATRPVIARIVIAAVIYAVTIAIAPRTPAGYTLIAVIGGCLVGLSILAARAELGEVEDTPVADEPARWGMHAYARLGTHFHAGPIEYVRSLGLPYPIVEVEVVEVAHDDATGTHWGWLKNGAATPTAICPAKSTYASCFTRDPELEELVGNGRTVRLKVTTVR